MGLADYITAYKSPPRKCKVCDLPADLREAVDGYMKEGIPPVHIHNGLLTEGHSISTTTLWKHRAEHLAAT